MTGPMPRCNVGREQHFECSIVHPYTRALMGLCTVPHDVYLVWVWMDSTVSS